MKKWHAAGITVAVLTVGLFAGAGHDAQASYIDPGSGSYLFQLAIAGAMGGFFMVRQAIVEWRSRFERHAEPKQAAAPMETIEARH